MATTRQATSGNSATLAMEQWRRNHWREYLGMTFWKRFMGTSPNSVIQVSEDLTKRNGDAITFNKTQALDYKTAVEGDSVLEGNESALGRNAQRVTIDQLRKAVRLDGRMTEQRSSINLVEAARANLREWSIHKFDYDMFTTLAASPTTNRVKYGGGATTEATITSNSVISTGLITALKRFALTGNGGASEKMRPFRTKDGLSFFVLVAEPYALKHLKDSDTNWRNQMLYTGLRTENSSLWTGSLGTVDGVVIYEHPYVQTATTGDENSRIARNLFLGAQAGFCCWGQRSQILTKSFDYDNQQGFACREIRGLAKAKFTDRVSGSAEDHGCIVVRTTAIV